MATLTPPRLDDRNYDELRNELIRRIPVHSPEWTDHNVADPGIVLLELFAWMGDNLLYRLNRVPEKAHLEFLNLLNQPLRPATVARTMVRFSLPDQEPRTASRGGSTQATVVAAAGGVDFQISDEITVLPVEGRAFIKKQAKAWEEFHKDVRADVDQLLSDHDLSEDERKQPTTYETFALPEPKAGALPPATAVTDSIDRCLWVALIAPEIAVKGYKDAALAERLADLRRDLGGKILSVGAIVDSALCGPTDHTLCPEPGNSPRRFPLQWQVATGRFKGGLKKVTDVLYQDVRLVSDGTNGLLNSGVIRLDLPDAFPGDDPAMGNWTAAAFDPPDAGLLGVGALPPRLDDPKLEERVLTWFRAFRQRAAHPDPRLRFLDVNMVEAEQAVTAVGEQLGYGNGRTGQVVRLSKHPVRPDALQVQVREDRQWINWTRVDDLARSLPHDPHYQLDAESGEIRFGDGVNGRIPLPGEMIRCLTYKYGGGARGNVPAEAIKSVRAPGPMTALRVTNPFAATGGRDAESVESARRRIPETLRHRDRAVAAEDFSDLALETPGVLVGRAETLPRHKPHERVDGVSGVVTLVVLPAYDPLHPDEPMPDRDMLRRVCEHLEPRRLATTELYVTPPEYVPIWVSAAIRVEEGYGIATVREWVELAIRQYLAPLLPYGPAGKGWPLGRAVREPDAEAAILRVEGVRLVERVAIKGPEVLETDPAVEMDELGWKCVPLKKWQLPARRVVTVVEDGTPVEIDRTGETKFAPPGIGTGVGGGEGIPGEEVPSEEPPGGGETPVERLGIGLSVPVVQEEC